MAAREEPAQIFFGSAAKHLEEPVCSILNVPPGRARLYRSVIGDPIIQVEGDLSGQHAYIVQSIAPPLGENFMELLFWAGALHRAGAESVTALIPFFGYATAGRRGGTAYQGRICVNAMQAAGITRLITVGVQDPAIESLCPFPYENLSATHLISSHLVEQLGGRSEEPGKTSSGLEDELVVVSTDLNFYQLALDFGNELDASTSVSVRYRPKQPKTTVIGEDVVGKTALIVDDYLTSAGSLAGAACSMAEYGAVKIFAAVTHAVVTPQALSYLENSPLQAIWVTDSIDPTKSELPIKFKVISLAPLIAETIQRYQKARERSA
jgi:ribose-phosphate pyrophosphokinase